VRARLPRLPDRHPGQHRRQRRRDRAPTCGWASGRSKRRITVTSQAPLLDTSNAIKQTTITKAELDALP
jgi:hypothetical protein